MIWGPNRQAFPLTFPYGSYSNIPYEKKASVAAVVIRIHYSKMVTMLRADNPDMGDGHAATEAKLLQRLRELVTYCLAPRLAPDLVKCVLDSMMLKSHYLKEPSPGANLGSFFSSIGKRNQETTHFARFSHWNRSPSGRFK